MDFWIRSIQWLALSAWFGSWALFAAVLAPIVFRTLPVDQAGDLVGQLLPILYLSGAAAGILCAIAAAALGHRRILIIFPLVLASMSALSHFGLTPAVNEVVPSELAADSVADAAARFAQFHELSRALFMLILIGVGGLILGLAKQDPGRRRD